MGDGMNVGKRNTRECIAAILVAAAVVQPLVADLPMMQEKEWLGFFQGFENKHYRFGIASDGKGSIRMIGKKKEPLGQKLTIDVTFLAEETQPGGKVVGRSVIPASLESGNPASDSPKDVVIRGKVTGDAAFEVKVSEDRGVISIGGRLLDMGKVKNPLRFAIRLRIPNAYPYDSPDGSKKEQKAFEGKSKEDRIQLTWNDGKRIKPSTSEAIDAGSEKFNGPGIKEAEFEFGTYQANKFEVVASGNSVLKLSNSDTGPLRNGFLLTWTADPVKDPKGEARLSLEVK